MRYKYARKSQFKVFGFLKYLKIKHFLILSLIFGSFFTVQLCAKFVSNIQGSGVVDEARVADYDISVQGESGAVLNIDCNTDTLSASYPFSVTNSSEVVTRHNVSVTLTGQSQIPNGITLTLDGQTGTITGNVVTFEVQSLLEIGETQEHTLTFTADPNSISSNISVSNIAITAHIVQVD